MLGHHKILMERSTGVLLLLCLALFIPYIILCFYCHPVADDYNFPPLTSFWNNQWRLYHYWNGRYSANFMVAANPIIFNSLIGYRFSAFFILIAIPVALFSVIYVSAGKALSSSQKTIATIVISVLILNLLPSLPEGVYWYTG